MLPNTLGNIAKHSGESEDIPGIVCITHGNEGAGSVHDFMEFVVQNIA